MVITPKKDGTPRRTIDLSGLTRAGIRESHHTRSAAKIAHSVPANQLKSTLDCVDGYHGVELDPEDRHKTTFITEWGKYRYKWTPQGYGSSGDGVPYKLHPTKLHPMDSTHLTAPLLNCTPPNCTHQTAPYSKLHPTQLHPHQIAPNIIAPIHKLHPMKLHPPNCTHHYCTSPNSTQ